ncbi:hypothetical protein P9112_012718 [Eukaryota sp. TZLM1-RC]
MDDVVLIGDLKIVREATHLAQNFEELRGKVFSQLLGCKIFQIPDHAYLSPHYGGLGWTKVSILTSCACIGGCRTAIFEYSERFADGEDFLMTTQSSTIFALNEEISKIDVKKWSRSFSQSFNGNIPEKNFLNLKKTLRRLQKRLAGIFGLFVTHGAFEIKIRLYLNIPINQLLSKEKCICSNSPQLTLRQAMNCSKLITYRSSLLDAVGDIVFNMARTARISCIKEPLLKETLSLNNFGSDDRGDVYCDWIENSELLLTLSPVMLQETLWFKEENLIL